MRASAASKSPCQGQRAGRCSVQPRAWRVRRPGSVSSRRRRVRAARTPWRGGRAARSSGAGCARGGDHGPGAVGGEVTGGEVRKRLVFEVADDQFDDGVLTVLGLDQGDSSVRLVRRRSGASRATARLARRAGGCGARSSAGRGVGLGDLRLPVVGVVDRLSRRPGICSIAALTALSADADRVLPAGSSSRSVTFLFQNPESARSSLTPAAGARDARDQLVGEARRPPLGVRRSFAQPDMQRLARARPRREHRVIPEQLCSRRRRPV